MSSFTRPHVVPNLRELHSAVEHKKKIFWRVLITKELTVAIDFHSIYPIVWKSMGSIIYLVTDILQKPCLCIQSWPKILKYDQRKLIWEKHLFHNDISPNFKFLLFNERLYFCDKKKNIWLTMQINFHSLLWSCLPRVPIFLAMTVIFKICSFKI